MARKERLLIGLYLAMIFCGCFLPWIREGDFISYVTNGIQLSPSFQDNGGLIVVILSLIISILIYKPPTIMQEPIIISKVLCIILLAHTIFDISLIVYRHIKLGGVMGAPIVEFGLILVILGSIFLLLQLFRYKNID
jgi:hypothetical protein